MTPETDLAALLAEQAALPETRARARAAGDGATLVRLAAREPELAILIDAAQTKARADQLAAQIAAAERDLTTAIAAAQQARTAADTAMAAVETTRQAHEDARAAFQQARADLWAAEGTQRTAGTRLGELQAAQRTLLAGPDPASPPPPIGAYTRGTPVPLDPTDPALPPHMRHLADPTPPPAPPADPRLRLPVQDGPYTPVPGVPVRTR